MTNKEICILEDLYKEYEEELKKLHSIIFKLEEKNMTHEEWVEAHSEAMYSKVTIQRIVKKFGYVIDIADNNKIRKPYNPKTF